MNVFKNPTVSDINSLIKGTNTAVTDNLVELGESVVGDGLAQMAVTLGDTYKRQNGVDVITTELCFDYGAVIVKAETFATVELDQILTNFDILVNREFVGSCFNQVEANTMAMAVLKTISLVK